MLSFNFSVYRYKKCRAAFCARCCFDYLGKSLYELVRLIPEFHFQPTGFQKENCVPCLFPGLDLVRILADANISGNDYPALLLSQLSHPNSIIRVRSELLFQMDNLMIRRNKPIQSFGDFCGEIVIEKEFQAARDCSYSTACCTDCGLISYHRATSSTEPLFASTVSANTWVAMPSRAMLG